MRHLLVLIFSCLCLLSAPSFAQDAEDLIRLAARDLATGQADISTPESQARLAEVAPTAVSKLRQVGPIDDIAGITEERVGAIRSITARLSHQTGISDWILTYSEVTSKIERIELTVTIAGEPIPPPSARLYRGVSAAVPAARPPLRQVEFLFATTRAEENNNARVSYTGERGTSLRYGAARVRIPEDHKIGSIELPKTIKLLTFEVYEQKQDPNSHFVIKGVTKLSEEAWYKVLQSGGSDEALVFVHGYNTSFNDSLYRMAQIVWDLQYKGKAILFSWASRGSTLNYVYDQQSALIGSVMFVDMLKKLSKTPGIKRVHVLAHSMGNLVMMEGLKAQATSSDPVRIAELIMAAPDLDRDYYNQNVASIRKLTTGMTLYASSSDKAMQASRKLAGDVPRAGDVPTSGPVVVDGVDTIDVTSVGTELLGLNHDVFASRRQVMNDIGLLLSSQPRKPPHQRLVADILGMPEGVVPPRYWRYAR